MSPIYHDVKLGNINHLVSVISVNDNLFLTPGSCGDVCGGCSLF